MHWQFKYATMFNNSKEAIYLFIYDVSDQRLRNRAVKLLERAGFERLQFSVFAGRVSSARARELWKKVLAAEGCEHNRWLCLRLGNRQFETSLKSGLMQIDTDYILGKKHTEIF